MKRSPHLRRLSVEHQTALSYASRLERAAHAAPLSELASWATKLAQYWQAELEPHFATEENIWLPALAGAGLRELTERTIDEHRALAALALRSGMPLRERLARFATLLQSHVRFEERELFEAAQRALTESELEALALSMDAPAD